ncbi:hypothetical protein LKM01_12675 [Bacillus pacificus]|uniref:hypothetical protein n=1 Tax=Bacillus cereus group TaxID=86661 RepID=UPI0013D4A1BB|nr:MULTISPECIES: hypothetical protein [Bacillus cereus group]MCC2482688.1 hypothetical protein [Bacillus pacificus]MDK7447160.1 hypothetical protein [Bacillus paranthracis]MDN8630394.1 hypothetical protein [Bacillus paranthracis]MDN8638501.1 hypothetical protein [Bacillus paranthracis]HDR7852001.1 hypothetical protein [Bacillus paranthracis]
MMKISNVEGHWRWNKWKEFIDVIYISKEWHAISTDNFNEMLFVDYFPDAINVKNIKEILPEVHSIASDYYDSHYVSMILDYLYNHNESIKGYLDVVRKAEKPVAFVKLRNRNYSEKIDVEKVEKRVYKVLDEISAEFIRNNCRIKKILIQQLVDQINFLKEYETNLAAKVMGEHLEICRKESIDQLIDFIFYIFDKQQISKRIKDIEENNKYVFILQEIKEDTKEQQNEIKKKQRRRRELGVTPREPDPIKPYDEIDLLMNHMQLEVTHQKNESIKVFEKNVESLAKKKLNSGNFSDTEILEPILTQFDCMVRSEE